MSDIAKGMEEDLKADKAKKGRLLRSPNSLLRPVPIVYDFFKPINSELLKTSNSVTRQSLVFLLQPAPAQPIPVRVVVKADAYPQAQGDASVYAWSGKAWQLVWSKLDAKVRQKECSLYFVGLDAAMRDDELSLLEIAHTILTGSTVLYGD